MSRKVLVLPGDGIGPEIVAEAMKVLEALDAGADAGFEIDRSSIGGEAIDSCGVPLPEQTLERARACDAILLGAVGGTAVGRACTRDSAGARTARLARRAWRVRESPSGNRVPSARGCINAEARRRPRARRADRPGADRWHLFRAAARNPRPRGRTPRGLQHPRVCRGRDRAGVPGGVRCGEATGRPRMLRRQGQRARGERAVARGGDERSRRSTTTSS